MNLSPIVYGPSRSVIVVHRPRQCRCIVCGTLGVAVQVEVTSGTATDLWIAMPSRWFIGGMTTGHKSMAASGRIDAICQTCIPEEKR